MELRKKKQKNVAEKFFSNFEQGDAYAYLCLKRKTQLLLAFSVGKWIQEVCDELYELIAKRSQQPTSRQKIGFCTDGNDQNQNAMLRVFNKDSIVYGQVIKDKIKQRIIGSHTCRVFGNFPPGIIRINQIDGFCSALRERISCFVRQAKTFAKKRKTINQMLDIYQAYNNMIKSTKGKTPLMQEGLTSSAWTWGKLLNAKISVEI